jgi:group II intron reverse transcriptase/maturase
VRGLDLGIRWGPIPYAGCTCVKLLPAAPKLVKVAKLWLQSKPMNSIANSELNEERHKLDVAVLSGLPAKENRKMLSTGPMTEKTIHPINLMHSFAARRHFSSTLGDTESETRIPGYAHEDHKDGLGIDVNPSAVTSSSSRRVDRDNHLTSGFTTPQKVDVVDVLLQRRSDKVTNLLEFISDPSILLAAYEQIKSKPGNLTAGADPERETLDGLSKDWLLRSSRALRAGNYKFRPARRVLIPKPKKPGETRPLTVVAPRDKIIQQAMKMGLEAIYEPTFMDTSHGFRPNRGAHTALNQIKYKWGGTSWFLEFDIQKCYDTIDRHRLVNILREKIDDEPFFHLFNRMLNCPVVGAEKGGPSSKEGVPQGSVLSPLLANIYLHKLDLEVEKIRQQFDVGQRRRRDPEFTRSLQKNSIALNKLPASTRAEIHLGRRKKLRKEGIYLTDWKDPQYIKVRYVRYADDFLLGIAGSKDLVIKIKDRISTFLKSDLKLSVGLARYHHICDSKVRFLGMYLSQPPASKWPRRFSKELEKRRRVKKRIAVAKEGYLKTIDGYIETLGRKTLVKLLKKKKSTLGSYEEAAHNIAELIAPIKGQSTRKDAPKVCSNPTKKLMDSLGWAALPKEIATATEQLEQAFQRWGESQDTQPKDTATLQLQVPAKLPKATKQELTGSFAHLPIQIQAPLDTIHNRLRERGVISEKRLRPMAIPRLNQNDDALIVAWYRSIANGLLSYYRCCDNLYAVKRIVDYQIRWSAIHTLANKHKSSSSKIIERYSTDLVIKTDGETRAKFLKRSEIKSIKKEFLVDRKHDPFDALDSTWLTWSRSVLNKDTCAVRDCPERDIQMHHVKHLVRHLDSFGEISVLSSKGKRLHGYRALQASLNRKQIPLCARHHNELHHKKLPISSLDLKKVRGESSNLKGAV